MSEFADDDAIRAKWREIAEAVDRLAARVSDGDDFGVKPGSSLAGDDAASHPFEVSQAVRHLINAAVDQLHGIKTIHVDTGVEHLAVLPTLARAAIENVAAALWVLGPTRRPERVERVLRWHARNYQDEKNTVGHLVGDASQVNLDLVRQVAVTQGLNEKTVTSGYKITTPIDGAMDYTDVRVRLLWSVASGFAHGRPWVYQGLLQREPLRFGDGNDMVVLRPRKEIPLWLTIEAMHLLGELLRLRDRRAGLAMPPMPDGAPDSQFRKQ